MAWTTTTGKHGRKLGIYTGNGITPMAEIQIIRVVTADTTRVCARVWPRAGKWRRAAAAGFKPRVRCAHFPTMCDVRVMLNPPSPHLYHSLPPIHSFPTNTTHHNYFTLISTGLKPPIRPAAADGMSCCCYSVSGRSCHCRTFCHCL